LIWLFGDFAADTRIYTNIVEPSAKIHKIRVICVLIILDCFGSNDESGGIRANSCNSWLKNSNHQYIKNVPSHFFNKQFEKGE